MLLPVCPTEPLGVTPPACRPAAALAWLMMPVSEWGTAAWQNLLDLLILDLPNGATCARQVFLAAAPAGLGGKFSSFNSALLAVPTLKPAGGAMFSKLVPSRSTYL